jgi:hypothetical protein
VEKSAIHDAAKSGILGERAASELTAEIDKQLAELGREREEA